MEDISIYSLYSEIKTTASIVWCVVSVLFCHLIALIFFVMAYEKYDSASNWMALKQYDNARIAITDASKNMHIGVVLFIVFSAIEVVVITAIVVGLIGAFAM